MTKKVQNCVHFSLRDGESFARLFRICGARDSMDKKYEGMKGNKLLVDLISKILAVRFKYANVNCFLMNKQLANNSQTAHKSRSLANNNLIFSSYTLKVNFSSFFLLTNKIICRN